MSTANEVATEGGGTRRAMRRREAELVGSQAITRVLEEDIVLGQLHPRERLTEDSLMARFGAKRHVVREALSDLARIGIVVRSANKGAAVADLRPEEVAQIYDVRELVEGAALARTSLPLDPAALADVVAIQRRHDRATAERDLRSIFRINIEFHRAIFALCGNAHLAEAIETFGQKAHGVRSFALSDRAYLETAKGDHWSILDALERADRAALLAVSTRHMRASQFAYADAYVAKFGPGDAGDPAPSSGRKR